MRASEEVVGIEMGGGWASKLADEAEAWRSRRSQSARDGSAAAFRSYGFSKRSRLSRLKSGLSRPVQHVIRADPSLRPHRVTTRPATPASIFKRMVTRGPRDDGTRRSPAPRRYWAAATIWHALTFSVLDGSIANVALPTSRRPSLPGRELRLGGQRLSTCHRCIASSDGRSGRDRPGGSFSSASSCSRSDRSDAPSRIRCRCWLCPRNPRVRRRRHHEPERSAGPLHLSVGDAGTRSSLECFSRFRGSGAWPDGRIRHPGGGIVAVVIRGQRSDRDRGLSAGSKVVTGQSEVRLLRPRRVRS